MTDPLVTTFTNLEADLKLPKGFFVRLLKEDDWSFVVKAHSLFEAVINRLLVESLGKPELSNVIESMGIGSKRQGKLAFVHALQLMPDTFLRFLSGLSQLRNGLVHRIENVTFSFSTHVNSMSTADQNNFYEWARVGETRDVSVGDATISRRDFVLQHTKRALTDAVLMLLVFVYLTASRLSLEKRTELARDKASLGLIEQAMQEGASAQANNLLQPTGQKRPAAE